MTSSLVPNSAHYDLALQLQTCQSRSRRNGKVARLPGVLREQINHMIDDGLPYKTIIKNLGPAGEHLNEDSLSNWRLGGYQDYLKLQAISERARIQTEAAVDLARETGHPDKAQLEEVCSQIALLQYLEALKQHGDTLARETLKKNPAKMLTLINACCNVSNTSLTIAKSKGLVALLSQVASTNPSSLPPGSARSEPIRT
jgi:hypothetical protein